MVNQFDQISQKLFNQVGTKFVPFLVQKTSQGMEPVRYQNGLGDSNKIHLQYNIVDRYNNLWTRLMQLTVTFAIPLRKFYFWLIIHPSVVMIDLSTT